MEKLTDNERTIVQRGIAAIIDHPSVYMGGPSRDALRKAAAIIEDLEQAGRLVPATCDHSVWRSIQEHGERCPTCGLDITNEFLVNHGAR